MKVRIKKNILVEVQKTRLQEVWDVSYSRWSELHVENINVVGKTAHLTTYEGDVILGVPVDAFEVVKS
jgi:hypothetical protein